MYTFNFVGKDPRYVIQHSQVIVKDDSQVEGNFSVKLFIYVTAPEGATLKTAVQSVKTENGKISISNQTQFIGIDYTYNGAVFELKFENVPSGNVSVTYSFVDNFTGFNLPGDVNPVVFQI